MLLTDVPFIPELRLNYTSCPCCFLFKYVDVFTSQSVPANFKTAGLIFIWTKHRIWAMAAFTLVTVKRTLQKLQRVSDEIILLYFLHIFFWFNDLSPSFFQVWRRKHGAHNQVVGKAQGPPWQLCAWHWDWERCFAGWIGWYFAKFVHFFIQNQSSLNTVLTSGRGAVACVKRKRCQYFRLQNLKYFCKSISLSIPCFNFTFLFPHV